jgi:hypothetical protein
VQIFPNAQMGNERDTAQAVRVVDRNGRDRRRSLNWVPEMSITDAPFLWKSRAQCWNAINGPFGDDLRKRCSTRVSCWTDLGFRSMTNNKHPINSAKDMQNLKMRVPNSKAYIAMMQATGATTVAVDLSELYRAAPGRGRRLGHAAVRREVEQVLRGAEVHLEDRAHAHHRIYGHQSEVLRRTTPRRRSVQRRVQRRQHLPAQLHGEGRVRGLRFSGPGMQANLTPDVECSGRCVDPSSTRTGPFVPELVKMARATLA